MKKYAVLSLDFEDWYHLDYLKNTSKSDREYSMLDGFDNFQQLITDNKLPASFFILSSIVQKFAKKFLMKFFYHQISTLMALNT